ncbi:N-terminal acetyltransferase complex ARD1 subunit [Cryptosporidium andersoni]|uniref:N-terminal acetyltransferase complex ARD1 subunit n=1 Tax=Cryptosporidium andersoni TaxID=117008 RepID=A0A1J4MZ40_9CRYT|nr:N-terminal acetyltransferase complex ARD1 subunit [Cryptosporidium andersoni]
MACLRRATIDDVFSMQQCNLYCLPENYQIKYYYFHSVTWPQLLQVATDSAETNKITGYVLAKIEDESGINHGHITSIAVLRSYRCLGIARKLLEQTHYEMKNTFNTPYCSLHVRVSNLAAKHLYQNVLNYTSQCIESKYYADNEDAYFMKLYFKK